MSYLSDCAVSHKTWSWCIYLGFLSSFAFVISFSYTFYIKIKGKLNNFMLIIMVPSINFSLIANAEKIYLCQLHHRSMFKALQEKPLLAHFFQYIFNMPPQLSPLPSNYKVVVSVWPFVVVVHTKISMVPKARPWW